MNELTVKIITLLIPGMITTLMLDQGLNHKEWKEYKYTLFIIFFGVCSYVFLQIFSFIFMYFTEHKCTFLEVWDFSRKDIPFNELLLGMIISIFLGLILLWFENRNVIFKILNKMKLSNKTNNYSPLINFLNEFYKELENESNYEGKDYRLKVIFNGCIFLGVISKISENYLTNEIELQIDEVDVYRGYDREFFKNIILCCKRSDCLIVK